MDRRATLGCADFGASAPIRALLTEFGFTADRIVAEAQALAEGR